MAAYGNLYKLQWAWVSRINSSGIATGQLDPDSPGSPPLTSSAYLIRGPMSLKTAKGKRSITKFVGGSVPEGTVQGGLNDIEAAELQVSQFDGALRALLQGGLVDTTSLSGMEFSAANNINPDPRTVAFCGIAKIDRKDSVKRGDYIHFFYPQCQMSITTPDLSQTDGDQTNPSPLSITITPSVTTKFLGGVAFGVNQGWYQNSEFEYQGIAQYPYFMTAWLQDGVATTFTLPYLPKKSTVTTGNTDNWVIRNGTPTAPTSINTSTGLVTMAAVGTSGQYTNVMFPVDPSLII